MATSSRQSALFGVQDWTRIYQTYREANFQSYDYETLRKSFIDYLTQYYPETYNDWIESSEFVALLDVIAFMGQGLAFRGDLNARENFIDTAERRDSVVKLANLVSYTPKRNTAGQGLIKVTAISTTEDILDINGVNLSNNTVLWNDPANPNWQEQFNSIINTTLVNSQRIGRPGNSQSILGVRTDEYTMNIPAGQLPVVPYTTEVDSINMNFELVSATSLDSDALYELPPAPSSQFNLLYRNDKLGYGSANTGFFFYFKQGTLQNYTFNFAEKIENNFQEIDIDGVNNTDTWLYQLSSNGAIQSRWNLTDNIFINADLQGTSARKIFSVTSRANDQVTYVFGDGVFGEIPVGPFVAYLRSGNSLTYSISPTEMNGIVVNIDYVSRQNRVETLTVTLSLQTTVNNALQRESIAQIKQRAPARYYTQNRMVNGEDYTNFPYTLYNSIVKSKAINRTSIGVSRNQDLLDPTGKYSSTNVFGDDGALYVFPPAQDTTTTTFSTLSSNTAVEFLSQTLPVFLSTPEVIQYYYANFPRYSGYYASAVSVDNKCYWKKLSVNDNRVTGYFYIVASGSAEIPVSLGIYSTENMQYITNGAQLKFLAPAGKYFDKDNRLQNGSPSATNGGRSYIWVGVTNVVGDGYNYGSGALNNGTGPVTLSDYVPSEAYLDNTPGAGALVTVAKTGWDTQYNCDNTTITIGTAGTGYVIGNKVKVLGTALGGSTPLNDLTFVVTNVNTSGGITAVSSPSGVSIATAATYSSVAANVAGTGIIASFDNTLGNTLVRQLLGLIDIKTPYIYLDYDNSIPSNQERWSYTTGSASDNTIVTFEYNSTNEQYSVTFKNKTYYFGSVAEVKFLYDREKKVFDPRSGQTIADYINVLKTNPNPNYVASPQSPILAIDYPLFVTGQQIESDGYPDDYAVKISTIDVNTLTTYDPDFFETIAGNDCEEYVFFRILTDINDAYVTQLLPVGAVNFAYNTRADILAVLYEYPAGTVFYASQGNPSSPNPIVPKFYQSNLVAGSNPPVLSLDDVTSEYIATTGRGEIDFQYRHNSNNTTRIDPSTTNIIDLYLVTQSYYTQYQNWLNDSTGTVPRPDKPTIDQLQQAYSNLDNYKMISDSVVLNSVTFKPLFGKKAETALQGIIKVIKSPLTTASDSQIRSAVVASLNSYFTLDKWDFGDTFYFSELSAYLHVQLAGLISSVVLVSSDPNQTFGDLYEIRSAPSEIFVNGATVSDVTVVSALTPQNLQR